MADTFPTSLRRPHHDAHHDESAQKMIGSKNGSPAPAFGETADNKPDVSEILTDARARAAAAAPRLKGTNGI